MLQHEEDAFNAAAAAKPKATSEVKGAARQTSAIMVGKTEAYSFSMSLAVAVQLCTLQPVTPLAFPPQKELRTTETEWKKDLGLHSSWDSAVSALNQEALLPRRACCPLQN